MPLVRTNISVLGFNEAEVRSGLHDLVAEFAERPWIIRPSAHWDTERGRLIVTTHYEGDQPERDSQAALDEVWDCVIACLSFSSEGIHFDIDDFSLIPDAAP
jgi:hypothetical protein